MTKGKKTYKCPFCDKEFNTEWKVINHIRQSRENGHGPMGALPDGFNPNTYEYTKEGVVASTEKPKTDKGKTDFKVEVINPPVKSKTEILLCPDCNTPKTEWVNINQCDEATADEKRAYDYICPNCKELIKLDE